MTTLLHLSDLHLGSAADEVLDDHELEVSAHSRQRRSTIVAAVLHSLGEALVAGGEILDAMVVRGDVINRGARAGFDDLNAKLANLGDALPETSRILVAPGNHDVAWRTKPGTPERYDPLVHGGREARYVIPLLEGDDLDHHGGQHSTTSAPVLVALDRSFALIGLINSDHCGVEAQTDDTLTADTDAARAGHSRARSTALVSSSRSTSATPARDSCAGEFGDDQ